MCTRAADLVRDLGILDDAHLEPLIDQRPPDLPDEVHDLLRHMFEAGGWVLIESAIADLPADLRWLFESGAVTLEQLARIHHELGATSAADLADAVSRQAVRNLDGLDAAVELAVGAALPHLRRAIRRIPLGTAVSIVEPILAKLRAVEGVSFAVPVGSLRRGQDTVGDIEILAATDKPAACIEALVSRHERGRVLQCSTRTLYARVEGTQVGFRFPSPDAAGAALLMLTGSPLHITRLKALAETHGFRLDSTGLHVEDGRRVIADTEAAIYERLGLPYIPAEIRNGDDEIDVALAGGLPALVAHEEIRGDLHMHTNWSDGRDTVESMVATCERLGYQYLAITDHSQSSMASRNLTLEGVRRQADEIEAARARHPKITILHGCEVDILPDGRLDFPDRVLAGFDFVLASLHDRAGQSPERLLERYTGAVRHPLVNAITHPTNRLVPHRAGYDLDYDRLFELAVETGTLLEVDGAPSHLDMDGALARRALKAGVQILISSDSHRAEALERQMALGVMTARRGWAEARRVLNTRPVAEVIEFVNRKRAS